MVKERILSWNIVIPSVVSFEIGGITLIALPNVSDGFGWALIIAGSILLVLAIVVHREKSQAKISQDAKQSIATSVFLFETLYWKLGFSGDPEFPLLGGERGFPRDTSSGILLLKVLVMFNIMANIIRVESIELNLMDKRIPSNWVSLPVSGTYTKYIYCKIPKWVSAGEHIVKLVAFANGKEWESSPPYMLRFPQQ